MDRDRESSVQYFLDLIQRAKRGKFKVYIGMIAGVGKSFRMLQEAHSLLRSGIDVKIGYVETHNRKETEALLEGLPVIPRRRIFYKGKELEEMDLQAILNLRPEVVIVDELAHTNVPGSKNEKRWQDVLELLENGINVISAVNVQHLESLNHDIRSITGVEVAERIPDSILRQADEVVNIDLTADELITRLKEGKIYAPEKVAVALQNFFRAENILQLRELALREVASQVERKVEIELPRSNLGLRIERFLACISSNDQTARTVIRKTARLANYYNSKWFVLYVQTPREDPNRIPLAAQRHLINNLKMATELGAEILQLKNTDVVDAIREAAEQKQITTICIGKPHLQFPANLFGGGMLHRLIATIGQLDVDLVVLS